jgi:hypothetical protein
MRQDIPEGWAGTGTGTDGVNNLLEELGVQRLAERERQIGVQQHLVEQERQHLLAQSTLMRQDIPEGGGLLLRGRPVPVVGPAHHHSRPGPWPHHVTVTGGGVSTTKSTNKAEAHHQGAGLHQFQFQSLARKSSSKKKELKPPPIRRPSRLPCRARGMPVAHDYNVCKTEQNTTGLCYSGAVSLNIFTTCHLSVCPSSHHFLLFAFSKLLSVCGVCFFSHYIL